MRSRCEPDASPMANRLLFPFPEVAVAASDTQNSDRTLSRRRFVRSTVERAAVGASVGVVACGLGAFVAACGKRARNASAKVVLYVSVDDAIAREAVARCTEATGIEIECVFDTEATKTTGLENRLRAERNRPRADIFWSSEAFATARLARDGVLAQFPSTLDALVSTWPTQWRDQSQRWLAFAARARVVVTRTDASPPWRAIRTWADLAAPDLWQNATTNTADAKRIAIADPRFGTTRGHLAALADAWARARAQGNTDAPLFEAWIDGLRSNGVRVLPGGNAATVEAVASGECAYGLTDTDDALAAIARGLPLALCLPRTLAEGNTGGGTMLVPNTVGLVAGRDIHAGVLDVLRWILSPSCETLLCHSASRNLPIGPARGEIACDCGFAEFDPLTFDVNAVAIGAQDLAARAYARLTANSITSTHDRVDEVDV